MQDWSRHESPERIFNRMAGLGMGREMAKLTTASVVGSASSRLNPLESIIEKSQLISSIYLALGAERMRAVGRIISESGRGFGTGFMISPRLLMTNNHVLEDAATAGRCRVQFDFVRTIDGKIGDTQIFRLVPEEFFLTADTEGAVNLDYTIVAVEASNAEGKQLSRRGSVPLIAQSGKLVLGDLANIIQHPGGEPQQVALRDSKVVTPLDDFIQYEADTQPGSSGSPVFNDFWQLAALHHSGVPEEVREGVYKLVDGGEWDTSIPVSHEDELRLLGRVKWKANEGIRISSIVRDVEKRVKNNSARRALFEAAVREQMAPSFDEEPSGAINPPGKPPPGGGGQSNLPPGKEVTWTIPLRVTVQLGPEMVLSATAAVGTGGGVSAVEPPKGTTNVQPAGVDSVVSRARESLAGNPQVLEVRSGFLWEAGEMTDQEAVVVVIDPQASFDSGDPHEKLNIPREIDGVPVDLTVGGASAVFRARERRGNMAAEAMPLAELFQEKVPQVGYQKPANVQLTEVNEPMEITAHTSPDDGWPVLEEFLGRTRKRITLGMFDLTAPQIVNKFQELGGNAVFHMNLAIQRGMAGGLGGEKKNDIPEDTFIEGMRTLMGDRFRQGYVDVSGPDRTFASAYHIKVAVRDGEEFWLSSGNMQTSNQPNLSPAADEETTFGPLKRFNREWHVVIRNKKLSAIFEKFLLHDLKTAETNPAEVPIPTDEALLPMRLEDPEFLEAAKKPRYFARKVFPKKTGAPVKVQPLLTPDNFLEHVIEIVRSAKTKLFIQNQSLALLQPLEKNEPEFLKLFGAILERQQAGVDVRMIFRVMPIDEDAARATKEALVKFGFKKKKITVLEGCHTKGVIVDSKVVIVGSHNWTNQGTIANRDASLIIHHEEIAKFYEDIFLFDWETRTREPKPAKPKKKRGVEESTLAGAVAMVRVKAEELIVGD